MTVPVKGKKIRVTFILGDDLYDRAQKRAEMFGCSVPQWCRLLLSSSIIKEVSLADTLEAIDKLGKEK